MKTKLLALALLAGSSMFAQTRFSIQIGGGGYAPRYYQPAPTYVAPQAEGYYGDPNGYQYAPQSSYAPSTYYAPQTYYAPSYRREERREDWERRERRARHEREERREHERSRDRW